MPARLERRQQTGNLHFLTFSCQDRNPYLRSPQAASIFEHSLEAMRRKYLFEVIGYVVMPEHVHLLMTEPPTHPLSTVIGSLKHPVSKQLPQSPFWLPRYHDFNVFTNEKRKDKLKYIHRNPVERGLVGNPEAYPLSSYNAHLKRRQDTVQVSFQWLD